MMLYDGVLIRNRLSFFPSLLFLGRRINVISSGTCNRQSKFHQIALLFEVEVVGKQVIGLYR